MEVKALACQLPYERNLPFSRLSSVDIAREAINSGIVASISGTTVWRWLSADAIKPWQYRSWIFPRDPDFAQKAGRVLDLYHGIWNGKRLRPNDYVISADEKTSIQARNRNGLHTAPASGRSQRIEFEYQRAGALAYIDGMFEEQKSLDYVHKALVSKSIIAWLIWSCNKSLIVRLTVYIGLPTMDRLTVAKHQ
jgi:hypothetical protein